MKKSLVFVLAFLPAFSYAQSVATIDSALNQATQFMNGRLAANSKVVVLNFTSEWPRLSEYIIEELIGHMVNEGTLTVVDRANIETLRRELNFQLSGDVSDETALSIGYMLGADTIISGSITPLGNAYRFRVRAIAVETARILGQFNVDVAHDTRVAALTGTAAATPSAAAASAAPAPARPAATPAAVIASTSSSPFVTFSGPFHVQPSVERPELRNSVTGSARSVRENIAGGDRDVLILTANIPQGRGYRIINFQYGHDTEEVLRPFRTANGIRFRVVGDGSAWRIGIMTRDTMSDYDIHHFTITPANNRVATVNIPYTQLRQGGWGRQVSFNRNNITAIVFERNSYDGGTGTSTIRIFDFEIY